MSAEDESPGGFGEDRPPALLVADLLRRSTALNAVLAQRMGLSVGDLDALHQVVGRPALGPVELAARLGMTSASATVLVDRLERAGYVRRGQDPRDRRRVVLEVTAQARERSLAAVSEWTAAATALDAELSAGERAVVVRYLERVVAAMVDFTDRAGARVPR